MKLIELKEQLISKTVKPLYIFTGPEVAIMDIYVNKIAEVTGAKIKRVDSIASIYTKVQNKAITSVLSCYIVRNDKDYTTQENAWQKLNNGVIQGNNIIILIYDNLDKRSKFYKQHQEQLVEFEKLSTEVLAKYIKKEIGLVESYGTDLANICNNDYNRILLECDKLRHLMNIQHSTIESVYKFAIQNKLIYVSPQDVIFTFIDTVCQRKVTETYKLYKELLATNENPLAIISLLYNNIRSMLLVQSAGNVDVCNRTGLTPWQVKIAKEKGNNYSVSELVKALRTIRETERGIKIGTIEQVMAIDYILVNIL